MALGIGYHGRPSLAQWIEVTNIILNKRDAVFHCIAIPAFKERTSALDSFMTHIKKPLYFISDEQMKKMIPLCHHFSALSLEKTGISSIAESCALAAVHHYAPLSRENPVLFQSKTRYGPFTFALAQNSSLPGTR